MASSTINGNEADCVSDETKKTSETFVITANAPINLSGGAKGGGGGGGGCNDMFLEWIGESWVYVTL